MRLKDRECETTVAEEISGSKMDLDVEAPQHKGDGKVMLVSEFEEDTDDLLEEGEGNVASGQGMSEEALAGHGDADADGSKQGNKQKVVGKQGNNTMNGKPPRGGRQVKKGMVALSEPTAQT
ncbi:PREDICTED: uncharacterized protein LOC104749922 [Camelina sativa]|uniref:Uncharacterized protein LOC104718868 n=1 Tax=Camelina sativa TaxID=90675 RepID=A0ABM0WEJ1_CAMSA|nr:PREDICTED: uncharacterized protein LOC104718868 [Camelina sativa]XP_010469938.1 PREDICTED: uncharacterized protein LOC104749922 [Camelina sativa]